MQNPKLYLNGFHLAAIKRRKVSGGVSRVAVYLMVASWWPLSSTNFRSWIYCLATGPIQIVLFGRFSWP